MPVPWVWIARCGARTFLALSCCAAAGAVRAGDFVFGDGFDIDLGNAFYVSASGLDTNPGTRAAPFRQITQ